MLLLYEPDLPFGIMLNQRRSQVFQVARDIQRDGILRPRLLPRRDCIQTCSCEEGSAELEQDQYESLTEKMVFQCCCCNYLGRMDFPTFEAPSMKKRPGHAAPFEGGLREHIPATLRRHTIEHRSLPLLPDHLDAPLCPPETLEQPFASCTPE